MTSTAPAPRKAQTSRRVRRRVEIHFGPEEPTRLGYSRNISRTGMMIGAVRVFAPGTLLRVRITLARGAVEVHGRVIWAREGPVQWLPTGRIGMGIRFIDPPADLLDRIEAPAAP